MMIFTQIKIIQININDKALRNTSIHQPILICCHFLCCDSRWRGLLWELVLTMTLNTWADGNKKPLLLGLSFANFEMTSYVEMSISSDHWRGAIYYVKPPIWGLIWTNFCQIQYFYDILWGAQMRIQWWRVGERTCSNQNVFPLIWEHQFIPHLNGVSITLWSYLMISF